MEDISRKAFNRLALMLSTSVTLPSGFSEERKKSKTAYIYHKQYLDHLHRYKNHPESPKRLEAINKQLKNSGVYEQLKHVTPTGNPLKMVGEVHSKEQIEAVKKEKSVEVIKLAVQGVLNAVDLVCQNKVSNAFCAIRPPGHHAVDVSKRRKSAEYGFCYFGNVAVAAKYAQIKYKLKKVLIVDWDYHHGNGTEWAFYNDPSVLFFSTHRLQAFPLTGYENRRGEGDGLGYNINYPMDRGAGDKEILKGFEKKMLPLAEKFKPDLVLISAGFDCRKDDLLGDFEVTDNGFVKLTEIMMDIAKRFCGGKLVSVLEGGYNLKGLGLGVEAHLKTLLKS